VEIEDRLFRETSIKNLVDTSLSVEESIEKGIPNSFSEWLYQTITMKSQ
jgi:hypothetical protein